MIVWMMSMVAASLAMAVAEAVAQGKYIFFHFTRLTKVPIYEWCLYVLKCFWSIFSQRLKELKKDFFAMVTIKHICKSK